MISRSRDWGLKQALSSNHNNKGTQFAEPKQRCYRSTLILGRLIIMAFNKKILVFAFISICLLAVSALESNAATLRWNSSSGNPDGYKVYYGTNPSSPSNSKDVGDVTAYNLDQLPLSESTRYYFCVSAYNAAGESDPCAPVGYTAGDTTPPIPPTGLVAYITTDSSPKDPPQNSGSSALISNLSVSSGKSYKVQTALSDGKTVYIDRSYRYTKVPNIMMDTTFIMTANDDKTNSSSQFITFDVSGEVLVYVAHDDRITKKPTWLNSFVDTGKNVSSDVPMSVYQKRFYGGSVTLGGNGGSSGSSMYTISVKR